MRMAGICLALVAAMGFARGADGPTGQPLSRAQAIQATLAALDQELAAHGGSYEQWGLSIKPYRDAITKIQGTEKWPWPATKNFVFQGSEISVVCADTFDTQPQGKRIFDLVLETDRQLKAQGIDLIFVPLPDKLSVYPDYLSNTVPADRAVAPAVKRLLKQLSENDVEVIDLYTLFAETRRQNDEKPLYYDKDSHWRNYAAQTAGKAIAERLMRYDFVQQALANGNRYTTKPEYRPDKPDDLMVVLDAKMGGRYRDDNMSPIVITGDSNLMYNMGATGAHLPAQVGLHIGMPLAFAPNTIPPQHIDRLAGRRVVIWANIARMFVKVEFPTQGGKLPRLQAE